MNLGGEVLGSGDDASDPHGPIAAGTHGDVDTKDAGEERRP